MIAPPDKNPPARQDPRERSQARRRQAFVLGLRSETAAVFWLRLKGYSILSRRYSGAGGEIDIVAARGDTIAFVEVKARPSLELASTAITYEKRKRMSRAARHWLARHPRVEGKTWRGDAVFLAPWRWPRHEPGIIELDIF